MKSSLSYTINAARRHAHLFDVSLDIADPGPDAVTLYLPVWTPGSYLVREFARLVYTVTASRNGQPVPITKLDKHRWQVESGAGALRVDYEVYAYDLSVRGAYLDTTRAFFNGTSLLLCALGRQRVPCILTLERPDGADFEHWRVATAMQPAQVDAVGFGTYRAADYEELIDHPFELGALALGSFDVQGTRHRVALSGRVVVDLDRVCSALARVCSQHVAFFGTPAPMAPGVSVAGIMTSQTCSSSAN